MSKSAVQIRYKEFIRRTGRAESADSVREFLHHEVLRILSAQNPSALILHGGGKTRYLDVVRHRLNAPSLSHEDLIERLCEKTQELDLKGR